MAQEDRLVIALSELERVLANQFRAMQDLIEITRIERDNLICGNPESLLNTVEDKEANLDRLSLIEDSRRRWVQEIALCCDVQSESTTIDEILPCLQKSQTKQIECLSDGIAILVDKARNLNLGNQALVYSRLDWLKATQSLIVSIVQPVEGYRQAVNAPISRDSQYWGMDYRA